MTIVFNTPIINSINVPKINFRSNVAKPYIENDFRKDSFSTNPLYDNFTDKTKLLQIAKSNPEIIKILKENKIPLVINIQELEKLKKEHLLDTRITAAKIYSALPEELKKEVNLTDLQEAAMLHDYGKVLIPEKILNKTSKLTEEEKKIMNLHSELGYELLKTQGVNENVLNLVKYHHQTPTSDGYPKINNNFEYTTTSQILSTADKYTALREKRSYKDAMSKEEALNVISKDLENGLISEDVFLALKKIA